MGSTILLVDSRMFPFDLDHHDWVDPIEMTPFVKDLHVEKKGLLGIRPQHIKLNLNPFTLVGATTKLGNLTSPLRDRFGVILRMDFYSKDELNQILSRIINIEIVK